VVFDRTDVGLAHVAAGPLDLALLIGAEAVLEEPIDGSAVFALADPHDAGTVEIVDHGDVLVTFMIRDFIDADGPQAPNAVTLSHAIDASMQDVRKRRRCQTKQLCGRLLGHQLRVDQNQVFKAIADASEGIGPRDWLLHAAVGGTDDLLGTVAKAHGPATDADVTPNSDRQGLLDLSAPPTFRAAAAVFLRLDIQV